MTLKDILGIASAILVSLGGAGAIILGLSNWLGKVWADRLLQRERASHELELAHIQSELEATNERALSQIRTELDIYKDQFLKGQSDKISTYHAMADMVATLIVTLTRAEIRAMPQDEAVEQLFKFEAERIRIYGYLAMLAPQSVMDAYDALVDQLLEILEGRKIFHFAEVRTLAIGVLNEIRKDIGLNPSPIQYRGHR